MEKNIEVHMSEGQTNLTILEGQAQAPKPLNSKVKVEGSILAPSEYMGKHYHGLTALQDGIVTYSLQPDKQLIKFDEQPSDPIEGAIITGKLVKNSDLDPWKINTKRSFNAEDLIDHIVANAFAMEQKQAKDLIALLRDFEVKFENVVKQSDNKQTGAKDNSFKQEIKFLSGQLPTNLSITMPLYKGSEPVLIPLEIEMKKNGDQVEYSFWSLTMENDLRTKATEIVTTEVAKFKPLFVCIEQI